MAATKYEIGYRYTPGGKAGSPPQQPRRIVCTTLPIDARIDEIIKVLTTVQNAVQPLVVLSLVEKDTIGFLFIDAVGLFVEPV